LGLLGHDREHAISYFIDADYTINKKERHPRKPPSSKSPSCKATSANDHPRDGLSKLHPKSKGGVLSVLQGDVHIFIEKLGRKYSK